MLKLEEYIKKRKNEDKINEYELDKRLENARICSNYVFEYFEKYLEEHKDENLTIPENKKVIKYRNQLDGYDDEIIKWLVDLYDNYGNYVNKTMEKLIEKETLFLLFTEESEFRALSYECFPGVVKKHRYLNTDSEMLFKFIKNHQKFQNNRYSTSIDLRELPQKIQKWIEDTYNKYDISLVAFAYVYIIYFYDNQSLWPSKHRHKSRQFTGEYEYDHKAGKNIFNIDGVYTRVSNKPFMRRHKKDLEYLFMFICSCLFGYMT